MSYSRIPQVGDRVRCLVDTLIDEHYQDVDAGTTGTIEVATLGYTWYITWRTDAGVLVYDCAFRDDWFEVIGASPLSHVNDLLKAFQ